MIKGCCRDCLYRFFKSCYRYPPVWIKLEEFKFSVWNRPKVEDDEWCGEFKQRPKLYKQSE